MSKDSQYPLRPTTKMLIELAEPGVVFANRYEAPPLLLGYPELLVLSDLESGDRINTDELAAEVGAKTGLDPNEILRLIKRMVTAGRLRRRARALPAEDLPLAVVGCHHDASWLGEQLIALKLPLPVRLYRGAFQLINHEGEVLVALTAAELTALSQFCRPVAVADAVDQQRMLLGEAAVSAERLNEILQRLDGARLLTGCDPAVVATQAQQPRARSRTQANRENFARQAERQEREEAERVARTGQVRPKVIPVSYDEGVPAALGLIFAYAKAYEGGALDEFYDFRLDWVCDDERLKGYAAGPAVYLCSNYLWSHEKAIATSEMVKRLNPASITIHGGPDTPKYPQDSEEHFAKFPHIDIIVRGEGEATAAEVLDKLRAVIGQDNPDLSVLADVKGISYRHDGRIIRNPDRERIVDLDTIPSPYLAGLFDAYRGVPRLHVTLETNRGCPYGCTFCDWGSATTSKIRKFDMERIFGEIEWCSTAQVQSVSVADANFGVFERDVAVAERVAQFKRATGFPEAFGGSYAKNSTKYLQKIIKVMAEADILTQGVLSLQTMDDGTLEAIKRSNIKVSKYDALANEMRNSNLQLSIELMMGLPGATLASFIEDLQQCIDRDIQARINHTTMLVNSPMNAPDYRAEHQIETGTELGPGKLPVLVSTRTYTRDDMNTMLRLRALYMLLDNFGVLRLTARFVRQQTGMEEMAFYQKLLGDVGPEEREHEWPILNTLVNHGHHLMAPVYSWALVLKELRRYLVERCDIPDDSALKAILTAQLAVLPTHGREFPFAVDLPHDVVAWHEQMLAAKAAGHLRDWQMVTAPLSSYGPGRLEVDDVNGSVTEMLGCNIEISSNGVNWDMESGVGRARVSQSFNPAWEKEHQIA